MKPNLFVNWLIKLFEEWLAMHIQTSTHIIFWYLSILLFTYNTVLSSETLAPNQTQPDSNQILLSDYWPFDIAQMHVYSWHFEGEKKGLDTVSLKMAKIQQELCLYFGTSGPGHLYDIAHIGLLDGIFRFVNDSLFYLEVYKEADIANMDPDQMSLLFPSEILLGKSHRTYDHWGHTVDFTFSITAPITVNDKFYDDCILLERVTDWEGKLNRDSVWLAREICVVKRIRTTGRVELLVEVIPNPKDYSALMQNVSGKKYVNSNGIEYFATEMIDGYKYEGDFSTPVYNSSGFLVREDFWGVNGEMAIKFITYEYDSLGRLCKEYYHYTESFKPDAPVKKIWLNEFIYSENNELVESRHKFDINDPDYYAIKKYDNVPASTVEDLRYSRRHPIRLN